MRQMMTPHLKLTRMKQKFQKIVVTLLYYAKYVDFTMLTAINTIIEQQPQTAEHVDEAITQLLDYSVTHPNVVVG